MTFGLDKDGINKLVRAENRRIGRWVVGICLTIGAAVLGLGAIGK